jgi:ABC-2 type transport system ATP-binding protein
MLALEVKNLSKNYGSTKALDNLSFSIKSKEKIALLGCNGAGKSTLLSLVMGLKKSTSGECLVLERNPEDPLNKKEVSFLPQSLNYPEHLKVKEILKVIGSHFKGSDSKDLIEELELTKLLNRQSYSLSGGERRKLGVALSLLRQPKLLIMDEPTASIDLIGKNKIYDVTKKHLENTGCTFIFSSHEMQEVEHLAERVIVLNKGEIVADGSVQEVKDLFGLRRVCFTSKASDLNFTEFEKHEIKEDVHTVYGKNSDLIVKSLFEQTKDFKDLRVFDTSLEEIFVNLWANKKQIKHQNYKDGSHG